MNIYFFKVDFANIRNLTPSTEESKMKQSKHGTFPKIYITI